MNDRELMQMALDALEDVGGEWGFTSKRTLPKRMNVIEALRTRLAQPEPEPVAWMVYTLDGESVCVTANPTDFTPEHKAFPLYTAQPQREWQGLTDEDLSVCDEDGVILARYWEAKLKEKNT